MRAEPVPCEVAGKRVRYTVLCLTFGGQSLRRVEACFGEQHLVEGLQFLLLSLRLAVALVVDEAATMDSGQSTPVG